MGVFRMQLGQFEGSFLNEQTLILFARSPGDNKCRMQTGPLMEATPDNDSLSSG